MICLKQNDIPGRKKIWFADKINHFPLLNEYCQASVNIKKIGYYKEKKFTKIVDITLTSSELLDSFKKNTQYEIKRSKREGVTFQTVNHYEIFKSFYNQFAASKNLPLINDIFASLMNKQLFITKAFKNKEPLVMHSYLVDFMKQRARLLHSASNFRIVPKLESKSSIGRANRFLHYEDMIFFKNKGIKIYGFGGYALNNPALSGINKFKDAFNGALLEEYNYTPFFLFFLRKLKHVL